MQARPRGDLSGRGAVLCLIGIAALSISLRVALLTEVHGPFIFLDELGYQKLAQSLGQSGHLAIFNKEGLSYSPLYSVVLAPIYALGASAPTAYHWAKVVNALLMSLSVVPIYNIARFVLVRRAALLVAGLSAVAPLMYYTAMTMSENLAYPLFLACIWAMLVALRSPGVRADAVLVVSMLAASAARIQLIMLFPAALTAVALVGVIERERPGKRVLQALIRTIRQHWLLIGSEALLVLAVVVRAAVGHGALAFAGRYSNVWSARASPWRVLELTIQHLAGLDIGAGVVPFAGALVAAFVFVRYGSSRESGVFASVAVSVTAWLLLEVAFDAAAFLGPSSSSLPRIEERYLIYLVPLFITALFAVIRVQRSKASFGVYLAAAFTAALLPATIPFTKVINNTIVADSFGLQLLGQNVGATIVPIAHPALSAISFAGTLALTYVLVRTRRGAVVVLVALVFIFMSALVRSRIIAAAAGSTQAGLPTHRDWVDRANPTGDVVLIGGLGARRIAVWETAYNNLSITRVYYACVSVFGSEFGEEPISVGAGGRLRDSSGYVKAQFAVVPPALGVRGRVLARNAKGGLVLVAAEKGQLTLAHGRRSRIRCA
jgi:hypothetical protein